MSYFVIWLYSKHGKALANYYFMPRKGDELILPRKSYPKLYGSSRSSQLWVVARVLHRYDGYGIGSSHVFVRNVK